jgi:glycosyltransferase involved in cell wall biosynthesis
MLSEKLGRAKGIVAISEFNRQYLMKTVGAWVGSKTQIIHCGIDPRLYSRNLPIPALKRSAFEILSIGSLRSYKGFTFLLNACAILSKAGFVFRCRIVGGGELEKDLLAQINKSGLQDVVELIGPKTQHEVAQLLMESDCYVQPSIITSSGKMEGIPVSLMEALAAELPVIATNISGVPELIRHNDTGFLVPSENSNELAAAIMRMYDHPLEAKAMAAAGRNLVLNEFNIEKNTLALSDFFNSFLIEPRPSVVNG